MEGDPAAIATLIHRAHAAGRRIILNLAPAIVLAIEVWPLVNFLVVLEVEVATLARVVGCAPKASLNKFHPEN